MAKSPAEILKKTKQSEKKTDNDKDDKKGDKAPRRNALIDFIAKNKKATA